jgi:hypothetical protein
MAKYRLTGPDGSTYEVTAPDSASQDEVMSTFRASIGGSTKESRLADQQKKDRELYDPTKGMSGFGKFVAGYGSAVPRLARGIGQRLGINSQEEVDEANKLDRPLLETGAGTAGNIAGNVGAAVPTAFIPGANTVVGASLIGGGLGVAQPTGSDESVVKNALIGGVAGPAGLIAGRAIGSAVQGGRALLEPFSQGGRDKIGGRVLQRFADDPSKIAQATDTPTVTGARPTLAEQTGDAGLARLQDSLRSADPQIGNLIGSRLIENNASRVNALKTLAGEDGAKDFAHANRAGTAGPIYKDAFEVAADGIKMTPEQKRTIATLMKSPAIQAAAKEARAIAANKGTNVGSSNATGSVEGLHHVKMAMDDAIASAKASGNVNKAASIKDAQKRLVSLIEEISPDYKSARVTYAQMSKPINSMEVAGHLAKKGLSNGSDLSGTQTLNRNALLGAMKDERGLVKQATGRDLGGLGDVMEPADLAMLRSIASEVDRAGAVATAGNGPGSATAQRMASNNILHQLVGPTGLPKSWADSVLANTIVGKPLNLLYGGVAEPRIQQALAEAVLNPARAKAMLAAASPAQRPALLQLLQRTAAARTVPAANGLANRP